LSQYPPDEAAGALWQRLVESHLSFTRATQEFFSEGVDRIALLRKGLRGRERVTALYLTGFLTQQELLSLFPDLIFLASFSHGSVLRRQRNRCCLTAQMTSIAGFWRCTANSTAI
jgi:hypothetical protein